MEKLVKGRKVYNCIVCEGDIQIGEIHFIFNDRIPVFDENENQTGVEFISHRYHNKNCAPKLLYTYNAKEVLKKCRKGIHKETWDTDPDTMFFDSYCEWCGTNLSNN